MTTVLVARHGQTDWNRERRWQGHADPPLNDTGRLQAVELGRSLTGVPIEAIYASDLRRAFETAEIIAARFALPVVRDSGLREIDVGEWSGLTTAEIEERFPEGFHSHEAGGDGWGHGETHAAMSERVVGAVTRIAAAHPGGHLLCVLHGGTIRALLAHADGVELGEYRRMHRGPVNGAVSGIDIEGNRFRRID